MYVPRLRGFEWILSAFTVCLVPDLDSISSATRAPRVTLDFPIDADFSFF